MLRPTLSSAVEQVGVTVVPGTCLPRTAGLTSSSGLHPEAPSAPFRLDATATLLAPLVAVGRVGQAETGLPVSSQAHELARVSVPCAPCIG